MTSESVVEEKMQFHWSASWEQLAIQGAVRAGEVNQLEDAHGPAFPAIVALVTLPNGGAQPVAVDDHYFARGDLPQESSSQVLQSAAFRGHNPATVQLSQTQGTETQGIPGGDDGIRG